MHYILQPIADVLNEAELFRRFIDDIIWISASETSNERIRQALTSAFENSGLELTFRQACTAEKTGEVDYSENHGTINKPRLHEAYTVTFVEQPSCHSLDICENKWHHVIDAQINIQNMILPHVK